MTITMDGRLILPTNWQPDYLDAVLDLRPAYLYGSLQHEPSGRSCTHLAEVSSEAVAGHMRRIRQKGAGFTYTMNATCMGNDELTDEGQVRLRERLTWIAQQGARAVVTTNPLVLEMLKNEFPQLEAHVSVLSFVDTPRKARFFAERGADVIHVDPQVNRDFRNLEAIRRAVDCRLSVMVNKGCLLGCSMRHYHLNLMSHSQHSVKGRSYVDYCYHWCSRLRTLDPDEIMRAAWIRPQDMHYYSELGIDYFKLGGREKAGPDGVSADTAALSYMAQCYHRQSVDNLWDLLVAQQEITPLFSPDWDANARQPKVWLDSQALDGFIEYFREGHCDQNCRNCDYCSIWARKALKVLGDGTGYANRLAGEMEIFRQGSYRSGV